MLSLFTARQLVIADQREGADSDGWTDAQLLAQVPWLLSLEDVYGDDDLAEAYRIVLSSRLPVVATSGVTVSGRRVMKVSVPGAPVVACRRDALFPADFTIYREGSAVTERAGSWREAIDKASLLARRHAAFVPTYALLPVV